MKVNGTRVEDLAGTGLLTKQRYVIPLWASILVISCKFSSRAAWWLLVHAIRGWIITVPAVLLLVVYVKGGAFGVLGVLMWAIASALAWSRRSPESFHANISHRLLGLWRWQAKYRRRWHPAMDGTGLTRSTPDRQVYVPRVTDVRSTRVVDTLHVRLLHGQTPTELAKQAEGLRRTPVHGHRRRAGAGAGAVLRP